MVTAPSGPLSAPSMSIHHDSATEGAVNLSVIRGMINESQRQGKLSFLDNQL